jgi:predicted metal-dependent peptidase
MAPQEDSLPPEQAGRSGFLHLVESRKRPDISALLERSADICGLAMHVAVYENPDLAEVAIKADGRAIHIGPKMATYDEGGRAYLLAKAVLHHALRHPRRYTAAQKFTDPFIPEIFNLAASAIVNDALDRVPALVRPSDQVPMDAILAIVPDARMCSLEQLYKKIVDGLDGSELPESLAQFAQDNLEPYDGTEGDAEADGMTPLDDQKWVERLRQGFGKHPQGLDRLLRHLPKTKTPWQKILRSYVARHIGAKHRMDPSRPHRRWLALEPVLRDESGVNLALIPGSRPMPTARIAVAIDTSGSISKKLLASFLSEIAGIMRQMHVGVRVITIDADVQQIEDFTKPEELLGFIPKGGGGTAFEPAILAAAAYKPSVMIYLTDLEGPAPAKPPFPVIWATPPEARAEAPFGVHLKLD